MENMVFIEVFNRSCKLKKSRTCKIAKIKNIEFIIFGNLYDKNFKEYNMEDIYNLYNNYGKNIYYYLDGTYSLIIIDYKLNKLFVYQDFFGCNQNIYFFYNKNKLYISNKLKEIINQNEYKFCINYKVIKQFFKNGYIMGKETLVKKIYKVPNKKYLVIDLINLKIRLKKIFNNKKKCNVQVDNNIYNDIFKKICFSSIASNDISMTISSGYDTNYLLYTLRSITSKHINTFCIGGKIGRNEVPDAKQISQYYKDVSFKYNLVNEKSFNNYPEIVFALEGAVYESGIFLQYELAKLLKDSDATEVIVGECADQILNYELYHRIELLINKIKYNIKNFSNKFIYSIDYKPYKNPYEMASYKILKKNGILMNYMGINVKYPYLRKKFIELAMKVVKKNDMEKKYHKDVINNTLPLTVTNKLKKIGGATELKTLFIGDVKFEDIKNISKKSEFYTYKKFNDKYYEIDYYMKIIYLEIFKKIFIVEPQKYLKGNFNGYNLEEFLKDIENSNSIKK